MRRAPAGALVAALVAAAAISAGAAAKNVPGTTYVDQHDGFAITIPQTWKLIPRSKKDLIALIAQLKKKGKSQAALASTYSSILGTAAGVSGLTTYKLQAFAWPPINFGNPILTEVSVGIVPTSKVYGVKDLPSIGAVYANALAANKGSKIRVPKQIKLPAGPAEYIIGTIPAGSGGLATGIELYLLPHGKRLYELSFQIDARVLSQASLFTSIAEHFKFV